MNWFMRNGPVGVCAVYRKMTAAGFPPREPVFPGNATETVMNDCAITPVPDTKYPELDAIPATVDFMVCGNSRRKM